MNDAFSSSWEFDEKHYNLYKINEIEYRWDNAQYRLGLLSGLYTIILPLYIEGEMQHFPAQKIRLCVYFRCNPIWYVRITSIPYIKSLVRLAKILIVVDFSLPPSYTIPTLPTYSAISVAPKYNPKSLPPMLWLNVLKKVWYRQQKTSLSMDVNKETYLFN